MNLVDKYKPKSVKEILGHDLAIAQIKENLKKPILLHGSPGTGKTSVVHALASDLSYEIIEVNASDFRTKDDIDNIVGNSIKQQSLFKKGKIILVDELDGISGREDRGGLQALLILIQESKFPIIMVANDPWDSKFSSLRQKSKIIEFKKLNYLTIYNILTSICKKENIKINDKELRDLAIKSNGDARAAINDIEVLSYENSYEGLGDRKQELSIFNAVQTILKSKDPKLVLNIFDEVNSDINENMLWLEENIALEYKDKNDLANAYDILSKADVFRGRIIKWQHWRFLVYISDLITAGISLSKKEMYSGFTKYRKPGRILEIWKFNMKNKFRKDICKKLAKKVHTSVKNVNKDFLLYKNFIDKDLARELRFTDEEMEFMNIKL
ncbi:MAG: replication factor C large subunit [Candidatus Nanoarchaeia archaeon]|nr:replication factor C large subunit [Candidatus Nanoarchaeia archaeon]